MTRDEIIQKVNSILHQQLEIPLEQLVPEASLFEDLALDSLDAVDMLVYLEEHLKIKVDVEVFKNARRMEDLYNLVSDLLLKSKN